MATREQIEKLISDRSRASVIIIRADDDALTYEAMGEVFCKDFGSNGTLLIYKDEYGRLVKQLVKETFAISTKQAIH